MRRKKYTPEVDTTIRLCLQYHGVHKYLRIEMIPVIKAVYEKLTIPEIIDDLTIKPDGELGFTSEDSLFYLGWPPYTDESNEREELFVSATGVSYDYGEYNSFQGNLKVKKCLGELIRTNHLNLQIPSELYISNCREVVSFVNNRARIPRDGDLATNFTIYDPQKDINRVWIEIWNYTEDFIYANESWKLQSWKSPYSALPVVSLPYTDSVIHINTKPNTDFTVKFGYHFLGNDQRMKLGLNKVNVTLSDGRKARVANGMLEMIT